MSLVGRRAVVTVVPSAVTVFTETLGLAGGNALFEPPLSIAPAMPPPAPAASSKPSRGRSQAGRARRGRRARGGSCRVGAMIPVAPAASSSEWRNAATNSAALPNRYAGSFASTFANTASSSDGSDGFNSRTGGTTPVTCATASAATLSPSNGRRPVSNSKAPMPSE